MKALVTGGTGFVGSHLVEALAARGAAVTALVRSPDKAAGLRRLGARIEAGDLHDCDALERAAAGQDAIFHVAGAVTARDEAAFMRVNRDGTANLLRAASRAGRPRFVFVSSLAAAGPSTPGLPRSGEGIDRPVTAYGRSKLAGEAAVREAGLPWTILRPPMVYGPRDTEVLKVFRLARRGVVPVFGDGTQELSAVYGPDLAGALVLAAMQAVTVGRVYYPAHPETFSSARFAETVGRAVGRSVKIVRLPARPARMLLTLCGAAARVAGRTTILNADKAAEFLAPAWTCDPATLIADCGWRAAHDLARGTAATAQAYRAEGWI